MLVWENPMNDGLPMWAIYKHSKDASGDYVVRRWIMREGALYVDRVSFSAPSLEEARALVPPGLFRMPRQENDDPAICETWV